MTLKYNNVDVKPEHVEEKGKDKYVRKVKILQKIFVVIDSGIFKEGNYNFFGY